MNQPGIALLGLGPGDPELITRQAWDLLLSSSEVYLRTRQHPGVESLPKNMKVFSFDHFYESENTFEEVYTHIVNRVLELGKRPQGVIYAVPGHPFIGEATSVEINRRAKDLKLPVEIFEGLSFLESVHSVLEIDPLPKTVIVDSLELAFLHVPNFPPSIPAVIAQIHSRDLASEVKLTLMENYPDEFPVKLIHAAGTAQVSVEELRLFEIDQSQKIGNLTTLYIPPLGETTSFEAFQEVIAHLRAPDGCPWDRKQTHKTLRPYLMEETYELLDALDTEDIRSMREEFGDLLLQIVLHAQIASESGDFSMVDILHEINSKIVQRHPHVFGDLDLQDEDGVLVNWEILKAEERDLIGKGDQSLLDGLALALPALVQADQYQKRAARVGFDWTNILGVMNKIYEELEEVKSVQGTENLEAEIGDLLFSVVNLARWSGIDPESALRQANTRFRNRIHYIEKQAQARGKRLNELTVNEMEALWQQAKKNAGDL
jgi:tetrapyrrole methylase family protein/MazG family protein